MALAGFFSNKTLKSEDLPLKLAAVSRCYRAETSNLLEERGIYRVHEFTKVEMFAVSTPEQSHRMLEEIRAIQENCFESLGLHFVVLDMPPHELGAQPTGNTTWRPGSPGDRSMERSRAAATASTTSPGGWGSGSDRTTKLILCTL
jgi:seryl-tRNA synthetase